MFDLINDCVRAYTVPIDARVILALRMDCIDAFVISTMTEFFREMESVKFTLCEL